MSAPAAPAGPVPGVPGDLRRAVHARVAGGARFCGLFALAAGDATRLVAVMSEGGVLVREESILAPGAGSYPSLTPDVPAAAWYERKIRDLHGLEPVGHPGVEALVLPRPPGVPPPRPGAGSGAGASPIDPDGRPPSGHVYGEGVFTLPYGPVRSGVFESAEYVLETPGEEILHLRTRIFYKHRGVDARFAGVSADDGALLAERYEGVASVAHALAYCQAVEQATGTRVPEAAELVRLVHAELERIANHLESVVRHTEASGQAVAYAVFSHQKERVQRLRARLCGSRFGRGVVRPGGVGGPLGLQPGELRAAVRRLRHEIDRDLRRLMDTPSFVDRLRRTGVLTEGDAARYAVVGPVARASGSTEDVRVSRPYGAYARLGHRLHEPRTGGDALARQRVRMDEIEGGFQLVLQAIDLLEDVAGPGEWRAPIEQLEESRAGTGERSLAVGWAEAPQGEVLSLVEIDGGVVAQAVQRSASFQNLAAYPAAYQKDIFTDVAFVEASFGVSIAGVAG